MAERTTTVRCAEEGCRATASYTYTSQREYADIMQGQQRLPYTCTRHANPDQVLCPDQLAQTHVLVASRIPFKGGWLDGLFWIPEGGTSGSGFAFGPGFKAHADDFPPGTRLVVTARVELPAAQDGPEALAALTNLATPKTGDPR